MTTKNKSGKKEKDEDQARLDRAVESEFNRDFKMKKSEGKLNKKK